MKTLFLSIGHNWGKNTPNGVPDQGAVGNGSTEAQVTKKIIDAIVKQGMPGVLVVKVPEGLNLRQRIDWINKNLPKYPEAFAIELHLDSASSTTARGASVWYNDSNAYTLAQGTNFLKEYTRITGLPSRHVNSDLKNRHGNLGFVSEVKCASLLIELGFISNKQDFEIIQKKGFEGFLGGILKIDK